MPLGVPSPQFQSYVRSGQAPPQLTEAATLTVSTLAEAVKVTG